MSITVGVVGRVVRAGAANVAEAVDVEALLAGEVDEPADLHLARRGAELVGGFFAFSGRIEAELLEASFEVERHGVGGAFLAKGRFLREAANAPATGDTTYGFVEVTETF